MREERWRRQRAASATLTAAVGDRLLPLGRAVSSHGIRADVGGCCCFPGVGVVSDVLTLLLVLLQPLVQER